MIELRDLQFWYPDRSDPVLSHVSLQFERGEFILVAGPSGSS